MHFMTIKDTVMPRLVAFPIPSTDLGPDWLGRRGTRACPPHPAPPARLHRPPSQLRLSRIIQD